MHKKTAIGSFSLSKFSMSSRPTSETAQDANSWHLCLSMILISMLSTSQSEATPLLLPTSPIPLTHLDMSTLSEEAQLGQLKKTTMTLYFQDYSGGPTPTILPLTFSDEAWTFKKFGTLFVTDDSAPIARGQGIYVTSALDGSNTHVMMSIVFSNEEYGGSTLEVQGASKQFEKLRELAIVGGTGKFRLAKGYITLETIHVDKVKGYCIIESNITVWHY